MQGFRAESIAKTIFSQKSFFGHSMVDLLCLLEVLLVGFLIFPASKTSLKIECFFKVAMGILDGSGK